MSVVIGGNTDVGNGKGTSALTDEDISAMYTTVKKTKSNDTGNFSSFYSLV